MNIDAYYDISTNCLQSVLKNKRYSNEIKLLKYAVKNGEHFTLPLNGECLFNSRNCESLNEKHLKYLYLPFPITILQFELENDRCMIYDPSFEKLKHLDNDVQTAICLISLALIKDKSFIKLQKTDINPKGNLITIKEILNNPNEYVLLTQMSKNCISPSCIIFKFSDFYIENGTTLISPFNFIHAFINTDTMLPPRNSENDWLKSSRDSLGSTFSTIVDFCLTLNCKKVKTKEIIPSVKTNTIRRETNKIPFSSFKILTLKEKAIGYYSNHEKNESEKRSVKSHKRRSHIRHYKSGKEIHIKEMTIGKLENGTIKKVYNVEGSVSK